MEKTVPEEVVVTPKGVLVKSTVEYEASLELEALCRSAGYRVSDSIFQETYDVSSTTEVQLSAAFWEAFPTECRAKLYEGVVNAAIAIANPSKYFVLYASVRRCDERPEPPSHMVAATLGLAMEGENETAE